MAILLDSRTIPPNQPRNPLIRARSLHAWHCTDENNGFQLRAPLFADLVVPIFFFLFLFAAAGTGFLGSGKTTLMNHILKDPNHGMKFAIIENGTIKYCPYSAAGSYRWFGSLLWDLI